MIGNSYLKPSRASSKSTNDFLNYSKNTEFNTTCTLSQFNQPKTHNTPSFSKHPPRQFAEKQLSVKSFKSNNKSTVSKHSRLSFLEYEQNQQKNYKQEYLKATEESPNNFGALEKILKDENSNLKNQNQMLINEIYKLKASNKKYKDVCINQRIELQAIKQECQAQKTRANQMKDIIMNRLRSLQAKVGHRQNNESMQECQSLLEALTLSESHAKQ